MGEVRNLQKLTRGAGAARRCWGTQPENPTTQKGLLTIIWSSGSTSVPGHHSKSSHSLEHGMGIYGDVMVTA